MYATPDSTSHVPVWENYVVCQMTQASIGLMSPRIVLAGVSVDNRNVVMRFHVDEQSESFPEIDEVVDKFHDLTGDLLAVSVDIRQWDPANTDGDTRWTYKRWMGWDGLGQE